MSTRSGASPDLERVLAAGEKLRWHGAPDRRSFVVGYLASGIPLLFFAGPFVFAPTLFALLMLGISLDAGAAYLVGSVLTAAVVSLVVVFGGVYLIASRACDHLEYAVTDQRLIRFGGIVGRDYSTVDWANVEDFEVNVGLIDGRYDTGSLKAITAGSGGVTFSTVRNPYDVLDTIESARRGGSP